MHPIRLLFASLLLASGLSAQAIWYVDASAAGPGNGSLGAPFPTIQAGVNAASGGDRVLVAPGTYGEVLSFQGKAISVEGTQGPQLTILGGAGTLDPVRVSMDQVAGDCSLVGIQVTGGVRGIDASFTGTAIIENCRLTGNQVGLVATASLTAAGSQQALIVRDCEIVANDHALGPFSPNYVASAGMELLVNVDVLVENCLIANNHGLLGGGVSTVLMGGFPAGSGLHVQRFRRCRFVGNTASGLSGQSFGGGLNVWQGHVIVEDCVFDGNRASLGQSGTAQGGGVHVDDASLFEARNTQFIGNRALVSAPGGLSAVARGGAVSCGRLNAFAPAARFENCIFSGNVVMATGALQLTEQGASIFAGANQQSFAGEELLLVHCSDSDGQGPSGIELQGVPRLVATNCILSGHASAPLVATDPSLATLTNCLLPVSWTGNGSGNLTGTPLFVDAPNSDLHLLPGSPGIDAGAVTTPLPPRDLDGNPRTVGSAPDIGADEFTQPLPGTGDDLELCLLVNGAGAELDSQLALSGDVVELEMREDPASALQGGAPYLMLEWWTPAAPPAEIPALSLWLDPLQATWLVDGSGPLAGPVSFGPLTIPPTLSGQRLRVQGFVVSTGAANGAYAGTDARDLYFE